MGLVISSVMPIPAAIPLARMVFPVPSSPLRAITVPGAADRPISTPREKVSSEDRDISSLI